jgi:PAS domain S-box-containing protein
MHVIEDIVVADVIGQAPTAVVAVDTGLRVAVWNPAAERLFGIAADAAAGRSLLDLVVPENRHGLARQIGERAAAGRAWQGEFDVRRGDGSPLRVHAAVGPLADAEGRTVGIVAVVLEAEKAEEADRGRRLELLVQTSEILAASVDPRTGLQSVARIAAAWLSDLVVIDLLDAEGRLERAAIACSRPEQAELADELRAVPASPDSPYIRRVLDESRAEVVADLTDEILREHTHDGRHLDIVQRLGIRSAMFVPLAARGRVLGVMLLAGGGERSPFGPPDLAMAEDIARRVALALDGAGLLR